MNLIKENKMLSVLTRNQDLTVFFSILTAIIIAGFFVNFDFRFGIAISALLSLFGMLLLSPKFIILFIFLIVFVGDQFSGIGLVPQIFPDVFLTALLLILLYKAFMLKLSKGERFKIVGLLPLAGFLGICIISALMNKTSVIRLAIFLRAIFQFYLFFVSIQNLELKEKDFRDINFALLILFIIQLPVAVFKWFHFGYYRLDFSFGGENAGGTYGVSPGALSTILPLFAIGFLFPLYAWKQKRRFIWLSIGFILFSLMGGKRAFTYIIPFFMIYILTLFSVLNLKAFLTKKTIAIGLLIGFFGFLSGSILHPSLNPKGIIFGDFSPAYLTKKAITYTLDRTETGHSMGRMAATLNIIATLVKTNPQIEMDEEKQEVDPRTRKSIFIGMGPGKFLKSGLIPDTFREDFKRVFKVNYGFTGFSWMLTQVGMIGVGFFVLLFVTIFLKIFAIYKRGLDPYWKIFIVGVFGAFFVGAFDYFIYSMSLSSGKVFQIIFYYVIAVPFVLFPAKKEKI